MKQDILNLKWGKILIIFSYIILSAIQINFTGVLKGSEIFALVFVLIAFLANKLILQKKDRNYLFFLVVILIVQIISDVYNSSQINNSLRVFALIISSIFLTIFFLQLFNSSILYFYVILIFTFFFNLFYNDLDLDFSLQQEDSNYFKNRISSFFVPFTLLFLSFLWHKNYKKITILFLIILSIICIYFDARSLSIIYLFTFIVSIFVLNNKIPKGIAFVKYSLITLFLFYLFYFIYIFSVKSDFIINKNSKSQIEIMENPYNPVELILIGRSEIATLFSAISDKPFLGHGSWAPDPEGKYLSILQQIQYVPGDEKNYIHAHSVLFGVWAYSGILGFISCLFIVYILFRNTRLSLHKLSNNPLIVPFIFICFDFIWILFFSPISSLRTSIPLYSSFILTINNSLYFKTNV